MAFENNQQDAFNLRNDTESLKRLEAELDKATTAIGAAEVAAEEELAAQKLKNLIEQQKLRVKQLEQLIALEEDDIQELASLRLTLSEKQFEARKKELQKETQLVEKAIDEQFKIENKKRKNNKQKNSSRGQASSATNDIKNSSKAKATQPQGTTQKEYTNGGMNSEDKVDLGKHSFQSIKAGFDGLKGYLEAQAGINADLDSIIKSEGSEKQASQTSIDFAGELLQSINATIEAEQRLQEFRADAETEALNRRLIFAEEEQKRRKELADTELKLIRDRTRVEADIAFNAAHADELRALALQEKRTGYAEEYAAYIVQAGKFAVSREEFELNRAKKDLAASKKDAASGIIEAIQSGKFYKIFSTDNKEAVSKYKSARTAELKDKYNNEKLKDGKTRREHVVEDLKKKELKKLEKEHPEMSAEEREAKATEAAEKGADKAAESSAKLSAQFELLAEVSGNLAQQLSQTADKIGEKQSSIDTRLQGSSVNDTMFGSYWRQLVRDMNKIGAVNPYFKQEDFATNIETLVNKGISFDIKQRAFLMTIQEKIANTFNAADGTLLRLIRIQQQDTTAGRLGMESALNSFLNSMYETSEYLTDVASSVRGSLEEMQALMEGAAGTELEFQVQKWMGSLYSVGMSQEAVQSIAQTFGQIASGDVSGLTGSGTGNLLIMAANEAGKSIADILQDGLDAKETNELMQAMVNYLAEIAETSSDSRVVQQQLANVYGLKASDLKAATNLASSIKDVSRQDLTYSGMLGQLKKMANSMALRTSTGEMLSNVWDNFQYTMGSQMASNPILYLLPKVATLLEDAVGGIDLPFVNVMGFGVDLNTSVAQLMNVAAMSGSILGALGPMISGLAGAVSGSAMLSLAGIDTKGTTPVIARGTPAVLQNVSGSSISESGYIGNSSGDDIKNATLQDAADDKKKQMVEAKDEETSDDVVIKSQQAIIDIYNLLEEVAHGSQSLRVRVINSIGAGNGGSSSTETDTPSTNNTMNTDNGNWVLSF